MKKMLVLSAMAVFAFSSVALAVVDPDPDGMSIYFDTTGDTYCIDTANPFSPYNVYILLTNASSSNPVLAWEARVTYDGDAAFGVANGNVSWALTNDGLNTGDAVDMIVGTGLTPVAITGDATILASAQLVWMAAGGHAYFTIGRVTDSLSFPDSMGYVSQIGVGTPAQHIFGTPGAECAWIGGDCANTPVADEDMSWGGVKALY